VNSLVWGTCYNFRGGPWVTKTSDSLTDCDTFT
jgi:hypothetical protein